ncbi:hypothetical protein PSTG_05293 [Puccinia striiformis f. sp. tritici PST-78]|uniref:Uncharacterized protein n=1 Tax=Puccinia striiformis f. sp. tritici PST-78 TaxID=1165861 RepID=A0A0L0VQG3_9BASI|nr:hypothetical protein PSTG_05293 [Puccinia striiformis f. sp. tritici PST-78]
MADRVEGHTVDNNGKMDQDNVDLKTVDKDKVVKHAEDENSQIKDHDGKDVKEKDAMDKDINDENDKEDDGDHTTNNDSSSETDSDAGGTWTGPSAEVQKAFSKLLRYYCYSINEIHCERETKLTLDDVQGKIEIFKELQKTLLPSLKQQIIALVESLDLSESATHSCPDPESTRKILLKLGDALKSTRNAVEEFALEPPVPDPSHDRHLEHFKNNRNCQLLWRTKAAIEEHICGLFRACLTSIFESEGAHKIVVSSVVLDRPKSETHDPDHLGPPPTLSQCKKHIIWRLNDSCDAIDRTIEYSRLSEFAVLQREWRGSTRKLERQLEALAQILNGTYTRQKGDTVDDRSDSEKEKDLAHKARAIQLARSAVPIVKLSRIFYDKLSKTSIKQLPFKLDTEMTSDELGSFLKTIDSFYQSVNYMTGHLCVIFESEDDIDKKIQSFRNTCAQNIGYFEKALLALSMYLMHTSHTAGGCSTSQAHFKNWFLGLRNQLNRACINLKNATDTCFGDLVDVE